MTRIRNYTELSRLRTFEERYQYLAIRGVVGEMTFGYDRVFNQDFYRSTEWRRARREVIARDYGLDLGVEGHEIHDKVIIHHMNPMVLKNIVDGDESILDPEFLITTNLRTHNAIHYGDASQIQPSFVERKPGDTRLW